MDINRLPRRMGKTSLLVQLARDNNYILVEPDKRRADLFKRQNPDIMITTPLELRDFSSDMRHQGLLLDEGIPINVEKEIRERYKVVAGFSGVSRVVKAYVSDGCITDKF